MPIYDFSCRSCSTVFETLVRPGRPDPVCPECASSDIERLLSMPVVQSETTRGIIKRETRARDKKQAAEREHAQRQYEANHDH